METTLKKELKHISYSAIRLFCNCRRAFQWKYVYGIESFKRADYFGFGSCIHKCLEALYKDEPYDKIINTGFDLDDTKQAQQYAMARAMMAGYEALYNDNFEVINTELEFEQPIINPMTNRKSKKFYIYGRVDMLIRRDGKFWLVEHKTASQVGAHYIDKLWHDLQITLYAVMLEQELSIKIDGIIYNVLKKVQNRQGQKTIETFTELLKERYLADETLFFREEIIMTENMKLDVINELWNITQAMNTGNYYKNRSQCDTFGICEYFKICNSGDNPLIIENYYKRREENVTNGKERENNKPF